MASVAHCRFALTRSDNMFLIASSSSSSSLNSQDGKEENESHINQMQTTALKPD